MTDASDRARAIAAQLLEAAQMSDADVHERGRLAADAGYWRRLAPALSVGEPPAASTRVLGPDAFEDVLRHFADEHYFQTPPLLDAAVLARLNGAIDAVTAAGWPPVFAWIYDDVWALTRLPDIAALLSAQLGARYSQIPHIWTHVVPAFVGSAGWSPHFDGESGKRVSVWVALTDATLTNGCIHVVSPRRLAASFASEPLETGQVALSDALRALHGVRALPAPRGSVLGWSFDVLHWGGARLSTEGARRAISIEFIAADEPPKADETPLLPLTGAFPTLAQRLQMIGTAVAGYEKFEPGLVRFRALALRLRDGH